MTTGRLGVLAPYLAVLTFSAAGFGSLYLLFATVPVLASGTGGRFGAGLSTAVFMGTTVLVQFWLPRLATRVRPHVLVAASLLLLALPAPFYGWSEDLWAVLLITAVRGAGFGIITVVGVALVSAYSPAGRQGSALGIYGLATSITGVVAPPLGLVMLHSGQATHAYLLALLVPVGALALLGVVRRSSPAPLATTGPGRRGLSRVWRDRRLMTPALLFLPCAVAYGGLYSFLPLSSADAPGALLAFGAGFAAARFFCGPIADAVRADLLAVPLLALSLLGVLLAAWTTGWLLMLSSLVAGIGIGGLATASLVAIMAQARAGEGALASSVWNLTFDLGIAFGGLGLGMLAVVSSYLVVYLAAAGCVAVAFCVAVLQVIRRVPDTA
ncbi:MAG: arabinose efflux permease family protein [Blastococcus sp.]|nr:arabinose efflux permease family protein [Blastococcus sp.]